MIAVFGRSKKLVDKQFSVCGYVKYRYIKNIDSVRDTLFTGTIYLPSWYDNKEAVIAYTELLKRQPNICKNIKRI